ncbi:ExeM/NucH family extracellular endonuclease [Neptunicella sp. SCSIO 80796]|uniref:ExeM/NucH family extracellular endonuclease n=1 Tax=Neptunicella plasticusilytica TaxID=3117012 RepID=UPI003A4D3496
MKLKYPGLLALFCVPVTQAADLLISEYIEGSSNNKALEIFNPTESTVDLSSYQFKFYFNGSTSAGNTINLSGNLASGATFVVADNDSNSAILTIANQTNSGNFFNGDDAIELLNNGSVIDSIGVVGSDPGSEWGSGSTSTQNNTIRRKASILTGDTIVNDAFDPVVEWDGYAQDDITGLGSHTFDGDVGGDDGGDTGGGGDDGNGDIISNACVNCPDLEKIADASTFDDASYYAPVYAEINANHTAGEIKAALSDVIDGNKVLTYAEVWTALTQTDQDPANADNVILLYKGVSAAKMSNATGSNADSDPNRWNREHVWAKSHGFSSDVNEAYTDIHHLRPSDVSINSDRGNKDFDNSDSPVSEAPLNRVDDDSFEPRDAVKGDVARILFYMDVRYEGFDTTPDLHLEDRLTSVGEPAIGRLCRLIEWNNADPVDSFEQTRNDRIYELQGNRNPFIDHPEWVSTFFTADTCEDLGGDTGGDDDGGTGGDDGGTGGDTGGDSPAGSGDIFISEYVEGSGYNKALELFNPTAQAIDLASANYQLGRFANGSTSPAMINLTGVVSSGETFVIATSDSRADDAIKNIASQFSGSISHNGDDGYVLYKDGVVIDSFGRIGEDPGSSWGSDSFSTLNNTLRRNPDVLSGDTIIDDEFDPAVQWTGAGNDVFDGLGQHTIVNPEIYISEYIEGGSFNKAIELYNPSFSVVDLTAGNYQLGLYVNGSASPTLFDLQGSIEPHDVFVLAHPSAIQSILDVADQITGSINHNGDDAYVLFKDGVVIDSFGQVGVDPGSEWGSGEQSSKDHTLVRKEFVTKGDVIIDDAFDPAVEWDGFARDTTEYLGAHRSSVGEDPDDPVVDIGVCLDPATRISAIQGSGDSSPLSGETHIIEGVVTASLSALNGYFVQEEGSDEDGDSATSEGVFVYSPALSLPVSGSIVRVLGEVTEFNGKTQLVASEVLTDCGTGSVQPVSLSLPFASAAAPEAMEGMLVTSAAELTVSDNYNLGHFGEVTLSNGRLFTPTNLFIPDSAEAQNLAVQNALNKVILDDGMNGSDPADVIYPAGGLSAINTLRTGDTVAALTGILDYSFSNYRVIPTQEPTFVQTNPRTPAPELTSGNLKIASLNVLNLFNGNGLGQGFPTARGATTEVEFERQIDKTVAAIAAMNADIIGLMEIENDGFAENSAIADLTARLNAQLGAGTYAYVDAGGTVGTDEIMVALLYKPSVVGLDGPLKILDSSNSVQDSNGPLFLDYRNRPALNQKFSLLENGESLVVSVNHLKSKGSGCGAGDDDTTTGQGNCNLTRTRAAQALTIFLAEQFPDTPALIIGDLNSNAKEDPIRKIEQAGYTNLLNHFNGDAAYSYTFNGEFGYLDHGLANQLLLPQVVDAVEWHINADEPRVLDYNVENKTAAQLVDFYAADAYRVSDHDPVVISLQLESPAMAGDWDADGDIDNDDLRAFLDALRAGTDIDSIYDFNSDGVVNLRDYSEIRRLCTRSRCATE